MTKSNTLRAALAACSLALGTAAAIAQSAPVDRIAIQAQYKADRQACLSGQTMQADRNACLYDARLAREAALRGELGGEDPEVLARNRVLRCEAVSAGSEDECLRAMNHEGTVVGSVQEGIIVREFTNEEPVQVSALYEPVQ